MFLDRKRPLELAFDILEIFTFPKFYHIVAEILLELAHCSVLPGGSGPVLRSLESVLSHKSLPRLCSQLCPPSICMSSGFQMPCLEVVAQGCL
jgi:hypothetical protein